MIPKNPFSECLYRFDELISGERYFGRSADISLQEVHQNGMQFTGMEASALECICNKFNFEELVEWRINYFSLTQLMLPSQTVQQQMSQVLEGKWWPTKNRIVGYLSILEGLMDSLENRLRTNFLPHFETEIESGFIEQAKQLFESRTEPTLHNQYSIHSYDFAVVSIVGSVLERILQTLCLQHLQQVPVSRGPVESTFDAHIFSLEKAGVLDQAIAAKISSWLTMREQILCGTIDHLNRSQISDMIEGTRSFLNASLRDATGKLYGDACESLDYADSASS